MALVPKIRPLLLAGLLAGVLVLAISLTARAEPVLATYYADSYVGAPTASGELYDPYGFTAAHPYLPLGTELLVNHNGRSVVVRVNDRCYCGLDLSLAAAQTIGLTEVGIASVDMQILGPQAALPPEPFEPQAPLPPETFELYGYPPPDQVGV